MNLFLDDERDPQDVTWVDIGEGPWTIVRNQEEFQNILREHGLPAKISFDNDLGDGQGEGVWCVNWLIEQILDGVISFTPFTFTIHSKNNIASERMESKLSQFIEKMST